MGVRTPSRAHALRRARRREIHSRRNHEKRRQTLARIRRRARSPWRFSKAGTRHASHASHASEFAPLVRRGREGKRGVALERLPKGIRSREVLRRTSGAFEAREDLAACRLPLRDQNIPLSKDTPAVDAQRGPGLGACGTTSRVSSLAGAFARDVERAPQPARTRKERSAIAQAREFITGTVRQAFGTEDSSRQNGCRYSPRLRRRRMMSARPRPRPRPPRMRGPCSPGTVRQREGESGGGELHSRIARRVGARGELDRAHVDHAPDGRLLVDVDA